MSVRIDVEEWKTLRRAEECIGKLLLLIEDFLKSTHLGFEAFLPQDPCV